MNEAPDFNARIAHLVEQRICNAQAGGSRPSMGTDVVSWVNKLVIVYKWWYCSLTTHAGVIMTWSNSDRHIMALLKYAGRICAKCQKPLTHEQRNNKYCSLSCATSQNNTNLVRVPRKTRQKCKRCDKAVSGTKSLYCSNKCQHESEHTDFIKRWTNNEVDGGSWHKVSGYVRRWLSEQKGEQCWECGWDTVNQHTNKVPIQVEHVDGNPYNHRPENLKLICPNCHSLTATWGGGNIGHGRVERLKYHPKKTDV